VGVELYGLQQQLARTQAQLEGIHDQHTVIKGYREESELILQQTAQHFKEEITRQNECFENCMAESCAIVNVY
jgi:hypothetical protein